MEKRLEVASHDRTPPTSLARSHNSQVISSRKRGVRLAEITPIDFTQLILRLCVLVGCEQPSAEAVMLLFDHCGMMHPNETNESLILAAQLNAAGRYEQRVEHFNSLDAGYIGKLFSSFEYYHRSVFKEAAKGAKEETPPPPADTDALMMDIFESDKKNFKEGKGDKAIDAVAPRMVQWLESKGMLPPVTDELLNSVHAKAVANVQKRLDVSAARVAKWKSEERFKAQYNDYRASVIAEKNRIFYRYVLNQSK